MASFKLKRKTFGLDLRTAGTEAFKYSKNMWNKMGTAGKVATGTALAGGALMLGKSLFGNKDNK